jgi:hypothetical protein
MSHCRDEHDHSQDGHGHGHHDHEHDHDGPERGAEESLYSRIDRDNVRCLNEREPNSGKNVIKPWNEREDTTKVTLSFGFHTYMRYINNDLIHLACGK